MGFTISHSSYGKFVTCPKSFKFHYVDKLRPIMTPSHLIFGSAVDKGLNALVDGTGDPIEQCETELARLIKEDIEFFRADYDGEIIDDATKEELRVRCSGIAGVAIDPDSVASSLLARPVVSLSEKQRRVLAILCSASLRAKAALMFDAYKLKVLPHIKRVVSSQKEVRWTDDSGNEFVGVLDLVIDLDGHGEMTADNKTASRPYEQDSVSKSTQLALYSKVENKTKAAFIVIDKTIRKNRIKVCSVCSHNGSGGRHKTCDAIKEGNRCAGEWTETIQPEANIQIIVGDVNERLQNMTLEALSDTANAVKAGHFPRNLNACDNQYGRPCPYRDYCWKGDKTGLRVEPSREKK